MITLRAIRMSRPIAACLLASLLALPLTAKAQDELAPASPNTGTISLSLDTTVATAYYFRGIIQEDEGLIVQPSLELGIALDDSETLSLALGIWNSFHSEHTGAAGTGTDSWYEADLYAGISVAISEQLEVSLTYTAYISPNDAFATVEELAIGVSYDDSGLWGDTSLALNPTATLAIELNNSAFGPDEGVYLELGIAPGFDLNDSIHVDIPVTLGLGLSDYYETATDDDTFGYLSVGATATVPLASIDPTFGAWELAAGVQGLFLDGNTEAANTDTDSFELIGTISLNCSY